MKHEKTFAAIAKLSEIELELHRLKNALEIANRALDAKREWQGLTEEEKKKTWYAMQNIMGWYSFQEIANAIEQALKDRNT